MHGACGIWQVRGGSNLHRETLVDPPLVLSNAGTNPKDCDLPYSRGICRNLRLFFCELEGWPWLSRSRAWAPQTWQYPGVIDRESDDVVNNVWENRYYACCG